MGVIKVIPDISTIDVWALWNFHRVPHFRIFYYQGYTGSPHHQHIFKERKGKSRMAFTTQQVVKMYLSHELRPFFLVSPKEIDPPPHSGPGAA